LEFKGVARPKFASADFQLQLESSAVLLTTFFTTPTHWPRSDVMPFGQGVPEK
jgi:hypothetical protein